MSIQCLDWHGKAEQEFTWRWGCCPDFLHYAAATAHFVALLCYKLQLAACHALRMLILH